MDQYDNVCLRLNRLQYENESENTNSRSIGAAVRVLSHQWRGQDLNLRPRGYEPRELPGCSTPRHDFSVERLGVEGTGV